MPKKYMEVYSAIKANLYTKYPVGSMLPTEAELMEAYGASRTTIRKAVSMLREERLVDVRQGRGTQVLLENYSYHDTHHIALFHNVSDIVSSLVKPTDELYMAQGGIIDQIPAPDSIAARLEVAPGAPVYRLERLLEVGKTPFAYFKNYYPCELFPGLEKYSGQDELLHNMYQLFEKEYHVYFENGRETLSAQSSSFLEGKLLGIDPGVPLIRTERIAYAADHRVMEYAERLIRPDMLQITITMSGSPYYD